MGTQNNVGTIMNEAVSKVDEKGRIMIPKKIRAITNLKEGCYVNIKAKDKTIIIGLAESIADKYCGIFKVSKWPEDLDEFIVEATKRWWTNQGT